MDQSDSFLVLPSEDSASAGGKEKMVVRVKEKKIEIY
jgi:hypothetical protein